MKINMQNRHLCWPPYFFLGPAKPPHFFNSRIATAPRLVLRNGSLHTLWRKRKVLHHHL